MGAKKREALEQFNRDNIVSAARELFEEKGIEKTTMDDIARHADYSKSTIYVYFKSKEDIYNAIVSDCVDILVGELRLIIRDGVDFTTSYYQLCRCLVDFESKYPRYYASLMGENNITNSKKNSSSSITAFSELNELLVKFLNIGKKSKLLRKDIRIKPTALYMWSAIGGIIQLAHRKCDVIDKNLMMKKDEYLKYSFDIFYDSLVGR